MQACQIAALARVLFLNSRKLLSVRVAQIDTSCLVVSRILSSCLIPSNLVILDLLAVLPLVALINHLSVDRFVGRLERLLQGNRVTGNVAWWLSFTPNR